MSLVGVLTLIVLGAFGTGYWFAAWRYRERPVHDTWFGSGVTRAYGQKTSATTSPQSAEKLATNYGDNE